jgi:3-phytase
VVAEIVMTGSLWRGLMAVSLAVSAAAAASGCVSAPSGPSPVSVPALRETAAVNAGGDAADDPAIWVAQDPASSLVIATQKQGGIYLFDLSGKIVQEVPGGRPNNVDIREGFAWPGITAPIVGAGDRSDNALVFWQLNPTARKLATTPAARIPTGFTEVYGFCLGHRGDDMVAVATDKTSGDIGVWTITSGPSGLSGARISTFSLGSITEGCVVDDMRGVVYLADELHAIWEVSLYDPTGANKRQVDAIGPSGHLVDDIEGLSLWLGPNGAGYLLASVQGENRYAVYDRAPPHAFRGTFRIGPSSDGKADGVSGTDGIDIVSQPLGSEFPDGLMVVQDDENTDPATYQNFKFVSWRAIADALGLDL